MRNQSWGRWVVLGTALGVLVFGATRLPLFDGEETWPAETNKWSSSKFSQTRGNSIFDNANQQN